MHGDVQAEAALHRRDEDGGRHARPLDRAIWQEAEPRAGTGLRVRDEACVTGGEEFVQTLRDRRTGDYSPIFGTTSVR